MERIDGLEELAEFAAQALELRQQAHKLELEQATLNEHQRDHRASLRVRAKLLRTEAARIYAPVLEAMEEETKKKRS